MAIVQGVPARDMPERMSEEASCALMLDAGAVSIRDVDGAGEDPFHYSSGNFGPGYVMVKGLVARQDVFDPLTDQLALKLIDEGVDFDHVAGNATGGMVPAYAVREAYQDFTGKRGIEYVYVRGTRKQGGHGELVTGLDHITPAEGEDADPASILVVEELVNFAETTTNSLLLFRDLGFTANQGACILHYDHDASNTRLAEAGIDLTYLTTLPNLLTVAANEGYFSQEAVDSYRAFLADTSGWMKDRGLENVPHQKG